jgi:hypothetical protein
MQDYNRFKQLIRRFKPLITLLVATSCLISAQAEESGLNQLPSETPRIKLRLYQEEIPHAGQITRAILLAETNQFSFVVPLGFRSQAEQSQKRIILTSRDHACSIVMQVHESPTRSTPKLKPEEHRAQVLSRYPGAKIVDEFTASIESQSGPAFEVEWQPQVGGLTATRLAFVPYAGGYLEFVINAPVERIRKFDPVLNQLLLSFRSSPIGAKLEVQTFFTDL